ncbi:hypothetical protein C8J56DRAFT_888274 [Mycena floridula]|nr:hypothetical protein C8J56DRAFT_888274 [Mycena floridula]
MALLSGQSGADLVAGPNHLHIADAAVIRPVLTSRDFFKGTRYTPIDSKSVPSLLGLADYQAHAQRRKFWDRALNLVAVKNYQEALNERVGQLVSQLKQRLHQDETVDLAQWLSFFCVCPSFHLAARELKIRRFDVMGDMVGVEANRSGVSNAVAGTQELTSYRCLLERPAQAKNELNLEL